MVFSAGPIVAKRAMASKVKMSHNQGDLCTDHHFIRTQLTRSSAS
jgi:hypothetical protein